MTNGITVTVDENKARSLLRNMDAEKVREFIEVVERAYKHNPNKKDIQELQKWLDEHSEIWRVVFDVARVIENNLINHMVPDQATHLALEKNADCIRRDFGYEDAPAMEMLLIDNIVVSWLRCQWMEYQLILFMGQSEVRMSVVDFWERRLTAAQGRYLRACETLAKIRRLASKNPTLQVNIATQSGQQVNVAGDVVKK